MTKKTDVILDIGILNTKIVAYKKTSAGVTVLDFAMFDTPTGMFTEEEAVNILPEFILAFKNTIAPMGIKLGNVSFVISGATIIMRETTLPKLPEKQLKAMIKLELPQHFLVDVDDYTIDYKIMDEIQTKDGAQYVVMLVAAPNAVVESYVLLSRACSGEIEMIDFSSNSISRLEDLSALSENERKKTYAFIDIGHTSTDVSICRNGALLYNRVLNFGSYEYQRAIDEVMELKYEETMQIKKTYDLRKTGKDYIGEKTPLDVRMTEVTAEFIESITRIFDFHISRELNNSIDKIILLGGGSAMQNMDLLFAQELNIETNNVNLFKKIKIEKKYDELQDNRAYYANCIAAIM